MTKGGVELSYLCPGCGSNRAVMPPKPHDGSIVHCSDCQQALGPLSDIRRELAAKAREEARELAKRIYRQGRGAKLELTSSLHSLGNFNPHQANEHQVVAFIPFRRRLEGGGLPLLFLVVGSAQELMG